jgi:hypothetical protein
MAGLISCIRLRIFSSSTSTRTRRPFAEAPSRFPRSLIWRADSSPETYNTVSPRSANFSSTCNRSVDFPMPGSPPTRMADPPTIPPPRTRSISTIPVVIRSPSSAAMSSIDWGTPSNRRSTGCVASTFRISSSTNRFHSPQEGHLPSHFGDCWPQFWQKNIVLIFFTGKPPSGNSPSSAYIPFPPFSRQPKTKNA